MPGAGLAAGRAGAFGGSTEATSLPGPFVGPAPSRAEDSAPPRPSSEAFAPLRPARGSSPARAHSAPRSASYSPARRDPRRHRWELSARAAAAETGRRLAEAATNSLAQPPVPRRRRLADGHRRRRARQLGTGVHICLGGGNRRCVRPGRRRRICVGRRNFGNSRRVGTMICRRARRTSRPDEINRKDAGDHDGRSGHIERRVRALAVAQPQVRIVGRRHEKILVFIWRAVRMTAPLLVSAFAKVGMIAERRIDGRIMRRLILGRPIRPLNRFEIGFGRPCGLRLDRRSATRGSLVTRIGIGRNDAPLSADDPGEFCERIFGGRSARTRCGPAAGA